MPNEIVTLIDNCAEMCGSDKEVARRVGVHPVAIAEFRARKRQMTPETVALLAGVLDLPGVEVQRLAALAVIENPKNAARKDQLKRAFFGCVTLFLSASLSLIPSTKNANAASTYAKSSQVEQLYIVGNYLRLIVVTALHTLIRLARKLRMKPDTFAHA